MTILQEQLIAFDKKCEPTKLYLKDANNPMHVIDVSVGTYMRSRVPWSDYSISYRNGLTDYQGLSL